jgi:hypothetical protein
MASASTIGRCLCTAFGNVREPPNIAGPSRAAHGGESGWRPPPAAGAAQVSARRADSDIQAWDVETGEIGHTNPGGGWPPLFVGTGGGDRSFPNGGIWSPSAPEDSKENPFSPTGVKGLGLCRRGRRGTD